MTAIINPTLLAENIMSLSSFERHYAVARKPMFRCRSSSIGSTASTQNESDQEYVHSPLSPDQMSEVVLGRHTPPSRTSPQLTNNRNITTSNSKLLAVLNGTLTCGNYQSITSKNSHFYREKETQQEITNRKRKAKEDIPMDLSTKRANVNRGSILKSILTQGRNEPKNKSSINPSNVTYERKHNIVQLAKKTVAPVSRRVAVWLKNIVQFANSLDNFKQLALSDQIILLKNAWPKLLLLEMAESNFEFVTTSVISEQPINKDASLTKRLEPTEKDVSSIMALIEKCHRLAIDQREFQFLREVSLINASRCKLNETAKVTEMNCSVRRNLHAYSLRPESDPLRYASLLLVLPELCSLWPECLETLFCTQILKTQQSNDVESLLIDMLSTNNVTSSI